MNKYILSYSKKLNESIGNGSVLLINGRPMKNGRYLYVTTIKGYVEIRPGLKMVFLGDQIYRVVHKGDNNFSGRKVSYNGEDGLKGVLNMKNPGRPSLVLNNNKTPFHWITLKFTDIGTALRSIGSNLFGHERILESDNEDYSKIAVKANQFLLNEFLKLALNKKSILKLIDIDKSEYIKKLESVYEVDRDIPVIEIEFTVDFNVIANKSDVPAEYINYFEAIGLLDETSSIFDEIDDEDLDVLGIPSMRAGANISLIYYSHLKIDHEYEEGDRYSPSYSRVHITDSSNYIYTSEIYIDGGSVSYGKHTPNLLDEYEEYINDLDVDELFNNFKTT